MKKKIIFIVIGIVLIGTLCIGAYVLSKDKVNISDTTSNIISTKSVKKEEITAENYEKISKKVTEELEDTDDTYYFSYACMYYIMKDGFTQEYMTTQDESLLYKNIYNKTVQNLIDEGKELMKDNNITVEQYKQQLEKTNNNIIINQD